jgi:hypothetical protein
MKVTYKLGIHKIKLLLQRWLKRNDGLGWSNYDSKKIWVRSTIISDGKPQKLKSALVTFFHEVSHMIDFMQGHRLFYDDDPKVTTTKEDALDAYCEALVQFLMENKLLNNKWLEGFRSTLEKVKPLTEEEMEALSDNKQE